MLFVLSVLSPRYRWYNTHGTCRRLQHHATWPPRHSSKVLNPHKLTPLLQTLRRSTPTTLRSTYDSIFFPFSCGGSQRKPLRSTGEPVDKPPEVNSPLLFSSRALQTHARQWQPYLVHLGHLQHVKGHKHPIRHTWWPARLGVRVS